MHFLSKYISKQDKPYVIATILLGTLAHFLYELSGNLSIVALFCPINESSWEHLKLLYFPFLLLTVFYYYKNQPPLSRFFYCRFSGVVCGMAFILISYYTYTGIIGNHFLILDILIFIISVILSFYMANLFYHEQVKTPSQTFVFALWIIGSILFFLFTCFPPDIPLFWDGVN